MGRLVYFELIKAVKSRFFATVFCLAVLVSFLLQCGTSEYMEYVQGMQEEDPLLPVETFFEYVGEERRVARYQKEENQALASMTDAEYADISDPNRLFTIEQLEQLNTVSDERLSAVLQSAESFLEEAKAEENAFEVRRNEEILRLYSMPRMEITGIIRYGGDSLVGTPVMLFVCLLVLLTSTVSVAGEHDRRTWLLLHTAKDGRGKTLLAKYFSGWLIGIGMVDIFQTVSFVATWFKGGLLGAEQPVTVIDELALCPFSMLVWQYVLLSIACWMFTAIVMSTILTTISSFSKNAVIAYVFGSLVLGGCLFLLFFPPKTEWLAGPLALAEPVRYFKRYYVCNFFGLPILWAVVHAMMWAGFVAVLMVIANRIYCRKRKVV